jgi:hypothetical protein
MFPKTLLASLVAVLVGGSTAYAGGEPQGAATQRDFERSLEGMNERLASAGRSEQDVINGADLITAGYRGLHPAARRFGSADQAMNRRIAQQSLNWLWRAHALHARNADVNAHLLQAYGAIGGFYRDHGAVYPGAAVTAFGGASRLARRMVLRGGGTQYERDLEQYALAYATSAYAYGPLFDWWVQPTGAQEPPRVVPGRQAPAPRPVELPTVDAAQLSVDQRAQWSDVQDRFRSTSTRVHEARLRMNELAARLHQQRLTVHVQDAATAAKMQGFLEDAVDLVKAQDFALAAEALTRADYERARLKNVIGQ